MVASGVEDDKRITGARPRHESTVDPIRLQALIANRTRPSLACRAEIVTIEGRTIVVIEVPRATTPVGTSSGVYKRRAIGVSGKPECVPYHFHEMQSFQSTLSILDYSRLIVPGASWDDLDPLEFERLRRFLNDYRGDATLLGLSDLELAKALGAVDTNHTVHAIRTLGLLLFGKREALQKFIPSHEVAFQVLADVEVRSNEFFRYPLLRTMEECLVRFRAHNQEREIMFELFRIGVPDYSERAFREGLANALIHRDYTQLGAVYIQWYPNRLEISNPGGFPEGVTISNLLVTPPRLRNPLLADAFKRAGILERTARGVDMIFYEQLRNGRPAPSYHRSTSTNVVLELIGGEPNLNFIRLLVEETQQKHPLSLVDLLVLNQIWHEREITLPKAVEILQRPEQEARAILNRLYEIGLIEARGLGKGRIWHFSAATYRRLGESTRYIRQRGVEPLQQEQMIKQFVATYGKITRKQAAELCKISPSQAYRLLQRLVREGLLQQKGTKKGVFYEIRA